MSDNNVLTIKRTLSAPPETVFAAWTQPEIMSQWFAPGDLLIPVAEADLRIGGAYRIVMRNERGETYSPSGEYLEINPPEKLVFTWKWADSELVTTVTLLLRATGDGNTDLTLVHEGFPDAEVAQEHNQGWDGCLSRLASSVKKQPTQKER